MSERLSADDYLKGILGRDRVVLSRAITLVESQLESDRELADEILTRCLAYSGKSFRLGLTGVPGVGKSTFIDYFGSVLTGNGNRVAVLAVDPSSSISKGSILGDKTRMEKLSRDENAFIRPSPSGGSLGGVSRRTREAVLLCEAAGYDYIMIETVGVGQSETAVASMVDFFLLLMLPGAGDELQGMKKGIMEMADGVVIHKSDGTNLEKARLAKAEYTAALHLFPPAPAGWIPKVLLASSLDGSGIEDILKMLGDYEQSMKRAGWFQLQRQNQMLAWLEESMKDFLIEHIYQSAVHRERYFEQRALVEKGHTVPSAAARKIVKDFFNSGHSPG